MNKLYFNHEPTFLESLSKIVTNEKPAEILGKRIDHMVKSGGFAPVDLERALGNNDLVRINYLERGLAASKAVCRIYVPEVFGSGGSWGTGFMVSPGLMITNHHVIKTNMEAERSFAEFGFEADFEGIPKQGKRFNFIPLQGFVTSDELDYTIIAISPFSEDNSAKLSDYGFLRLNPELHKVEENEFVSIIQHPDGKEKLIAIRENKVIKIGDLIADKNIFIWYSSDTAPGSSGSPVLNDSWQVVALHHASVPETRITDGKVEVQLITGEWVIKTENEQYGSQIKWIANQGIRVSKIIENVISQFNSVDSLKTSIHVKELIDDATNVKPFPLVKHLPESTENMQGIVLNDIEKARAEGKNSRSLSYYSNKKGYVSHFLGINIPLPEITALAIQKYGEPLMLAGNNNPELKYMHFSVVLNKRRRLAYFTAVNIDGKKWLNITRGKDSWYYDPRIAMDDQVGNELYGNEPGGNYFDRGHLVRRQDPTWGSLTDANEANEDTFHWTNCAPQYYRFNQGQELWQGIENYILHNTDQEDVKATVFTGPVFSDDDEEHRGILIPQYFWKVVAVTDTNGKLYSSAYVVSQKKFALNIPFEELPVGNFNNFQTSLRKLENMTGLKFSEEINNSDVRKESIQDTELRSLADITVPRR